MTDSAPATWATITAILLSAMTAVAAPTATPLPATALTPATTPAPVPPPTPTAPATAPTPAALPANVDELDRIIEQRMAEANIVGIGAAVIVDKKVVRLKGYGFADKLRATPFTPHTIMNIASITKTITGAAVMRAVQDGKLSLDRDINAYLPFKVRNPNFPDAPITLRQLATHTSSIADRAAVYDRTYHYGGDATEDLGAFLQGYFTPEGANYAKDNFLAFKPGTHREYSNIGAGLAGYIVERAVGAKLNAYTKQHIFAPLKMNDTGWFLSEVTLANHSKQYVAQMGLSIPIELYGGTTYPDGGVRTSVADLAKFFIALLDNGEYDGARILSKAAATEMLRFQFTDANKPDNFDPKDKNSGIFWQSLLKVTRIGHGGSDPGVRTLMISDLAKQLGVIVFSNTSLGEKEMASFNAIVEAVWKQAETLRAAKPPARKSR